MQSPAASILAAGKDLRGTWPRAILSLVGAITMILSIRWAFFEPYVIPSGSMIPTLLIHDHILVSKLSFGIRFPFTSSWIVRFAQPQRGDVLVFRSVDDSEIFVVKRVIGLGGDEVRVSGRGQLIINGKPVPRRQLSLDEAQAAVAQWPDVSREEYLDRFEFFEENLDGHRHLVLRSKSAGQSPSGPFKVAANGIFMMGDNRDNSSDSRVWGTLPIDRVLGRASWIWMSCEETLPDASQLCDPQSMRWYRMAKGIR